MAKTEYETYKEHFANIKNLCIEAFKEGITTDIEYFIENGIPDEFMQKCKLAKLYGGGKKGQNIFWNWHENKKYPECTVDNFLEFMRVYGGKA